MVIAKSASLFRRKFRTEKQKRLSMGVCCLRVRAHTTHNTTSKSPFYFLCCNILGSITIIWIFADTKHLVPEQQQKKRKLFHFLIPVLRFDLRETSEEAEWRQKKWWRIMPDWWHYYKVGTRHMASLDILLTDFFFYIFFFLITIWWRYAHNFAFWRRCKSWSTRCGNNGGHSGKWLTYSSLPIFDLSL